MTAHVGVSYGGVRATDDVSLSVQRGEIVGLIGPNGAGKTSLVDAWCGFVAHDGTVEVNGHDVTGRPPHRRARAGLARTWQTVELIDDLTLAQNCAVAAPHADAAHLAATLERVGLGGRGGRRPGELSLGQRKLGGVARAARQGQTTERKDETDLPTFASGARTPPRLSGAHGDQGWPQGAECPSRPRTQGPIGLRPRKASMR